MAVLDAGMGELVELPVPGEGVLDPGSFHNLHGFGEETPVLIIIAAVSVDVEIGEFSGEDASADTALDAAAAQLVEQGDIFGDSERVPLGYYYGGKPQPDGGGLSSEVGEDHQRVGDAVISLSSEVMFAEPNAVESRLLNGLSLFGKLGQDLVIG